MFEIMSEKFSFGAAIAFCAKLAFVLIFFDEFIAPTVRISTFESAALSLVLFATYYAASFFRAATSGTRQKLETAGLKEERLEKELREAIDKKIEYRNKSERQAEQIKKLKKEFAEICGNLRTSEKQLRLAENKLRQFAESQEKTIPKSEFLRLKSEHEKTVAALEESKAAAKSWRAKYSAKSKRTNNLEAEICELKKKIAAEEKTVAE